MNAIIVYTPALITDAIFDVQRSDHTYLLSISFFEHFRKISDIAFKAIPIEKVTEDQANAFAHYAYLIENSSFTYSCDMQPINGRKKETCFLKDLIRESNIKDISNQVSYLDSNGINAAERINLFVLDIKDKNGSYNETKEIENAEEQVATFLQAAAPSALTPRRRFHHMIQNQRIRFFIREGKLKSNLIHFVLSKYADFFQKSLQGRQRLCQLCEIMMNFFKKGFAIEPIGDRSFTLHPRNYFSSTHALNSEPLPSFALAKIHALNLLTLYPFFYRELYCNEERYFRSLSKAFYTKHSFDHITKTTAITISNKT